MSFTPFARFKNFTLDNLKALLAVYPDEARTMKWEEAKDWIDSLHPGYKRTSYQQACQLGIEDRGNESFRIQNYLFTFEDANLRRYLEFWIKTYYAPNPYVKGDDKAFIIYCEMVREILAASDHVIKYDEFFARKIGGKSEDILLNAIKNYAKPVKVKKVNEEDVLFIEEGHIEEAKRELEYIERELPVINQNSKKEFFDKHSYEKFCDFFGIDRSLPKENEGILQADTVNFYTGFQSKFPRNRIIFGAPGTGKSYKLNQEREELLGDDSLDYERVTFHPNYSYANFVGTYKPVSGKGMDGKDTIRYEYVPGPFLRIYVKALENSKNTQNIKPYLLLIEEINRANVAAVFGEVFQLLDRDHTNVSEYTIHTTEDMRKYLADELHGSLDEYAEIKIPDNMFIWATMNSADQGVFPMDTAFKRRWEFEYIGIDEEASEVEGYVIPVGDDTNRRYIKWNDLRMRINDILLSDECRVNEDKLLGPFFISKNMLENALTDENRFVKAVESKVIMYLFEDVMKMRPANIFKGHKGKMVFSQICRTFEENGEKVFGITDIEEVDRQAKD
ncbi:MAG: AAA family ATPase [Lachnospiraceae bacterium]|nr:AAA family ATPase [Lachnospiraceae bacterium]